MSFCPHQSKLRHHGLIAIEQLLSPNCQVLLSWKELHHIIPSLSHAVPMWFTEIESQLGVDSSQGYKHLITLPPSLGPLTVPNPFRDSSLSFSPLIARPDDFVAVFPATYADDGVFFLVKLIGWEDGNGVEPLQYHLQHWCCAAMHDDPDGVLYNENYYVQCSGDCDSPQQCGACGVGCCWWESSGVASLSSGVWLGHLHHVNFVGDTVAKTEFACVDMPQDALDELWHNLPDVSEEGSDLGVGFEPPQLPCLALQAPLALLCTGVNSADPVWSSLQAPLSIQDTAGDLTVYSDGSLQGSGSSQSCGGAEFVVLDGDKSLWEVAVHVGGWLSSTKAEVYACIMAMASLPVDQALKIYTDSQGLIAGFQSFVSEAHLQPFCHLLHTRFY